MNLEGVSVTPQKVIPMETGDVLHGIKKHEKNFVGFGEAYFSKVKKGSVKAWKQHHHMTLNILVPVGNIRFVLYDDREESNTKGLFQTIDLGESNYSRLTVPPKLWAGFTGLSEGLNLLMNLADLEHDPEEVSRKDIDKIPYDWSRSPERLN